LETLIQAGADEIIRTPLEAVELRQRVHQLLRLSQASPTGPYPLKIIPPQERNYRTLLNQAADGIVVMDGNGNYVEVNDRMCELTGYSQAELLAMNIRDLIHAEDLEQNPLPFEKARITGQVIRVECRIVRKEGLSLFTEMNSRMQEDGTFQAIVRDITERKTFEDALRNSEQKYRHLFEYANDSIFIIDVESAQIIEANRNAAKRLGYRRAELLKMGLDDIEAPGEAIPLPETSAGMGKIVYEHYHRRDRKS